MSLHSSPVRPEPAEDPSISSAGSAGAVSATEHWDLWRRDPQATPFQSPAWLDAWWTHLGGGERADISVRDGGGRLTAVLPAFIWLDGETRKLVPVGAGHSDYCDALLDPAHPEAAAQLWRGMLALGDRWDEILLPDLRPGSPLLGPVPDGLLARDGPGETCPMLRLDSTDLAAIIPKHQRRNLALARNRAARLGEFELGMAKPDALGEALDALFALHETRWRSSGEPGVLASPGVQGFHRTAAPALAEKGLLRMAVARQAGRIVAVLHAFADRTRWHAYISGVDMSAPGQSFGMLAFAFLLDAAIAEGAREFHFLRGEEPYKYSWGAQPTRMIRRVVRRA